MSILSPPGLALRHATVFTPDQRLDDRTVLIEGDLVTAIDRVESCETPEGFRVIEAGGRTLVPGFIDLQLNGGFGHDFTAHPESMWTVAAELPRHGVTAFLPTVITSPPETIARARHVLTSGPPDGWRGAAALGLHLEGPFLNQAKKGAHNSEHLRPPSPAAAAGWSAEAGVRLVTLAPELPGATTVIRQLKDRGVVVSAGHSMATLEEARAGFEAGIRYGTHLFNAMPPLGHREPGLVGALLTDPKITVGLIADGIHVHPDMIDLAWRARGANNINMVTDAMAALGMPPGEHLLADHTVLVSDKDSRLADGTLAGSLISLDAAVRNLQRFTNASLADAVATVTTVPATLLAIDHGRIAVGGRADLVLLNESKEIDMTIVAGEVLYSRSSDSRINGTLSYGTLS